MKDDQKPFGYLRWRELEAEGFSPVEHEVDTEMDSEGWMRLVSIITFKHPDGRSIEYRRFNR